MWKHPWGYKEGIAIGFGLILTGLLLQVTIGKFADDFFQYPVNLLIGAIFIISLVTVHFLSRKNTKLRWFSGMEAAITSISAFLILVIIMGLTRQTSIPSPDGSVLQQLGFNNMLSSWPFTLTFIYLLTVLGLTIGRRARKFRLKDIPFMLNHIGLFVALLAGVLGSAEMQRLQMVVGTAQPEWRATDEKNEMIELPLAIELHKFTIDEYPPKLMLIDNNTGKTLPDKQPVSITVDKIPSSGKMLDWQITVSKMLDYAAQMVTSDSIIFVDYHSEGATTAVYASARNTRTNETKQGWISNGSYVFPYRALMLDKQTSLVMPEREPKRYASEISIYTKDEREYNTTIEVNKPFKVDGWKIYQTSYDETKGRWSNISKFELVKDPWLVPVYIGIIMMICGAISLFVLSQARQEENEQPNI